MKPDCQFFEPKYLFIAGQILKKSVFLKKIYFYWEIFDHKNNKNKIENLAS